MRYLYTKSEGCAVIYIKVSELDYGYLIVNEQLNNCANGVKDCTLLQAGKPLKTIRKNFI